MGVSVSRLWTRELVAIDLGTARTRIRLPARDVSVQAPSVLARDGWNRACLAGWDAWAWPVGQRHAPDAPLRLVWPLHGGVVVNGPACAQLVRLLLRRASRRPPRRPLVVLGVPAGATSAEGAAAASAVAEATGGRIVVVAEPLAAALGAGLDLDADRARLIVDIGAGVTEVAAVCGDQVLTTRRVARGAAAFTPGVATASREPVSPLPPSRGDALDQIAAAVTETLGSLTPCQRAATAARGLLLSGGGALVPRLPARLSAAVEVTVTTASGPTHATIDGLTEHLTSPELSASKRKPSAATPAGGHTKSAVK